VSIGFSKLIARDARIPLPGHALVQLHDRVLRLGPARAKSPQRFDDLADPGQVLFAERVADALLDEQPAATRLRSVMEEARVGAVHRDAESERKVALELGRVERDEVRPVRVDDELADLTE
jgi:hypothetical protein